MSNSLPENSVERRRKVLKGALAASGVLTMGYSGSALASFNCIEKTTQEAPINGGQLVQEIPSIYAGWQWKLIPVSAGESANGNGNGNGNGARPGWFTYEGQLYSVPLDRQGNTWTATDNPQYATPPVPTNTTPVSMYLLVLYEPSGSGYVPATPSPYVAGAAATPGGNLAAVSPQPITDSCHASLNPGTTSRLSGG